MLTQVVQHVTVLGESEQATLFFAPSRRLRQEFDECIIPRTPTEGAALFVPFPGVPRVVSPAPANCWGSNSDLSLIHI